MIALSAIMGILVGVLLGAALHRHAVDTAIALLDERDHKKAEKPVDNN